MTPSKTMTPHKSALPLFLSSPRKSRLRLWAWRIHFYTGIVLAVFLLVLGVSGSCIVFRNELLRSFRRSPGGAVSGSTRAMGLQAMIDSAEAAHKGYAAESLQGLDRADGIVAIRMKGSRKSGSGKEEGDLTAYWDRTAGETTDGAPLVSRLLGFLVDFHKNLAMGREGRAVNGLVAIGFTGLVLSGLIVWWPGLVNWQLGFTLNTKLSWKRINYDLHNVAGIASIVFLMLMAGTAVCLAAKDIPGLLAFGKGSETSKGSGASKVSRASKGSEATHEGKRHGGGKEHRHVAAAPGGRTAKPIDELVELASLDPSLSRFQLSGVELRDKHGEGAQLLYEGPGGVVTVGVDSASGKILSKTEPGRFGMDPDAHNTIEAIHFGRWGGLASRVVWVLLGLTPGLLALTGLIMWWNRSLSKKLSGFI